MPSLSKRQHQVLAAIVAGRQRHGVAPSVKEISRATGIPSTNGVTWHLTVLERKGYIRRDKNTARGIQLLDWAAAPFLTTFWQLPFEGSVR